MPPLIRRRPLSERIKAYLDPWDYLQSLSESLDSSDWDQWQEQWATTLGIGLNLVFLIARANSGAKIRRGDDDVFGDDSGGLGVLSWLVGHPSLDAGGVIIYTAAGNTDSPCPYRSFNLQRPTYLPPKTPLPPLRDQHRRCT